MLNKVTALDQMFQALADSTRRAILAELTRGPRSVSKLAQPLAMSLPAVMQHLAVLESSGLVRSEKIGRIRTCTIEPKALGLPEQWINQRRMEWQRHFDQLGEYLNGLVKAGGTHD
jgi:DNA-binding transcriptional ArsR family regulator